MKNTLQMIADDIQNGEVSVCSQCPIARMINRYIKPNMYAVVSDFNIEIRIRQSMDFVAYTGTPTEAEQFMQTFDFELPVAPIAMAIDLPENVWR